MGAKTVGKNIKELPRQEARSTWKDLLFLEHFYIKRCQTCHPSEKESSYPMGVPQIAVGMYQCYLFVVLWRSYCVRVNEDEWGHCPLLCLY